MKAFYDLGYTRSKADPCLYFAWTTNGLIMWLSWVDACLVVGKKEEVLKAKKKMMRRFDCDEFGPLKEYIGCKVDFNPNQGYVQLTQPVLLQSFADEFELPKGDNPTPSVPGDVLRKGKSNEILSVKEMTKYKSGMGKLLHLMKWSRPEIINCV